MPDRFSLSPDAAARLAAGETVRVWVAAGGYPLFEGPSRGDRVKVTCPGCLGSCVSAAPVIREHARAGWSSSAPICTPCKGTGRLPALVAVDPEPGQWCEECEGEGTIASLAWTPNGVDQLSRKPEEYCSTCHGTPSWGWWLTIQRETP